MKKYYISYLYPEADSCYYTRTGYEEELESSSALEKELSWLISSQELDNKQIDSIKVYEMHDFNVKGLLEHIKAIRSEQHRMHLEAQAQRQAEEHIKARLAQAEALQRFLDSGLTPEEYVNNGK